MKSPSKTKRLVYATVGGLGLFAGAAGIAAAVSNQSPTPTTVAATGSNAGDQGGSQDATYKSSITSPETQDGKEPSEAEEAAKLQSLAKTSATDAQTAATAAVPGTAAAAELENADGNVVYSVKVTGADGKVTEVIVDAGNGKVLHQEADDGKDDEKGSETDKGNENDQGQDTGTPANEPTTAGAPGK
ncbi:MAG: PepSY domain-containing protein [Acidimicrobiia bacterium]